jgi:hypothetical protein
MPALTYPLIGDLVSPITQHYRTIQALPKILGSEKNDDAAYLDTCRAKRNTAEYGSVVFPRRFESKRTGKSGYQPVCRNEWIRPPCQKPKIKCGNQFTLDYGDIDEAFTIH